MLFSDSSGVHVELYFYDVAEQILRYYDSKKCGFIIIRFIILSIVYYVVGLLFSYFTHVFFFFT